MTKFETTFEGTTITVYAIYEPAEDMVWNNGDGTGYPGSGAVLEIHTIEVGGEDITKLVGEWERDQLAEKILEEI